MQSAGANPTFAAMSTTTNITGLTDEQVQDSREKHGYNRIDSKRVSGFWLAMKDLVKEPMFILLLATSSIYFIMGETGDGIFMAFAIVLVAAIGLYQDSRSRNALAALKSLTQPNGKVIRNGQVQEISIEEIVVGDCMMVEEGTSVPADGFILQSNDFSVNESILTGESMPVSKDANAEDHQVFQGTNVVGGLAICQVTAIGTKTRLGQIGKSLEDIIEEKTPLQIQIGNFVKKMVVVGAIVFLVVWGINFYYSSNVLDSLLQALTLAMSILPEEIPVAFSTFMALGAWRLMKMGIIVKQTKTVEALGSATVICTDKTGTITENRMSLAQVFVLKTDKTISFDDNEKFGADEKAVIRTAMWASEPIPFDPMEVALHEAYTKLHLTDERPNYRLVHEYPLSGKPPMMTHVFQNDVGDRIIAVKGAPEAVMHVSNLTLKERKSIHRALELFSIEGYRVLGVGVTSLVGDDYPQHQHEFQFQFVGLVAFYDPPKVNINEVFEAFYKAGINVKIVTGDNAATTTTIAKQVGLQGYESSLNGDALMEIPEKELVGRVQQTNIFTRMFPEAKVKIINALKAKGEIVAMTGDGVNDGPALKSAHIGIAMGKKGSEIAKQASSLILMEDDLSKMVEAVAMGRKIYTNLKKAIQYIISIHIPIILTVFLPLVLGWTYPNIFSPVHIIFLELIMGPTCSIIFENEPIEKNAMQHKPRQFTTTFFSWSELTTSIIQGLFITAGTLVVYQYSVQNGYNEPTTRTMVFTVLISANIFLTLVNRSFYYSIFTTIGYKNPLVPLMIGVTMVITALLLCVSPLTRFFEFETLSWQLLLASISMGAVSVLWFEVVKWWKRQVKP